MSGHSPGTRPTGPTALLAVVMLALFGVGLGFAASAMPADDTLSSESGSPVSAVGTEDDDPEYGVSELERDGTGTDIDSSLLGASGERVVILDVERGLDTDTITGDATGLLKADSRATLGPVAEAVTGLDGVTLRNRLWLGNLLTVEVELDRQDVRTLAAIEGVQRVVPNVVFELPDPAKPATGGDSRSVDPRVGATQNSSTVTYGLEQMDIPGFEATFGGERGGNATVAIVDNGLSNPDEGHPDLDIAKRFLVQNGNVTEGLVQSGSHGEHVAGTVTGAANPVGDVPRFGVAPEAELLLFDVFGTSAGASFEDIALGLEVAAEEGADVGGFSLGAANGSFSESTFEPTFTSTVEDANAAGMVVSVSSGNEGLGPDGGQVTAPATQFDAFTAGNVDEAREVNPGSSGAVIQDETVRRVLGDPVDLPDQFPRTFVKPDVSAAGTDVLSSGPLGTELDDPTARYSYATGTSMAQPHIAGAAALLQSVTDEQIPPKLIETALAETAQKPPGAPGAQTERDIRYGTGIINVTAAALALQGTQTVSGTITSSADGTALVGATVETAEGGLASARTGDNYTLYATDDPTDVTADAFGYEPETVSASESPTQAFELDPTVAAEVIDGQPSFVVAGNSFDIVVDVATLENITVELTANSSVSAENLTLLLGGQELPLGTTVDLDGSVSGEVTVTVETDAGIADGSTLGLVDTLAGAGDSLTVETGPTEVTDEVPPAEFVVNKLTVPDTVTVDQSLTVTAEVENVGGESGTTETLPAIEGPTTDGGETLVFLPPDTLELAQGETQTVSTEFGTITDISDAVGSVEWGPGTSLTAVQQVGENLNPSEAPDPVVEDEATAPFSVVEEQIEGPFFEVSALQAPDKLDPGAELNVSATVTNIGTGNDTQTVGFRFNGSVVDTEPGVALGPGENTTVEFTAQVPTEEAFYEHGVFTNNDSQNATLTVGQPDPPEFQLTNLSQPDRLSVNGSIQAQVEVTNVGGTAGQTELIYATDIDGVFIYIQTDIRSIQLDPGESTTISESLLNFSDINEQVPGVDYGPGEDVLTGFQVGETLDPSEGPDPVVEDELAANISIVEEPFLDVGGLSAPEEAEPGAELNVSATVTNTGGLADSQTVEFRLDGQTVANTTVELNASAATTVEFTATLPGQSGTFEHGVFTDDDSQTATITAVEPGPPNVTVTGLDIAGEGDNVTVLAGSYDVSVEMTHTGGPAGEVGLNLSIGGAVGNRTVSIAVGETLPVTFQGATGGVAPGAYSVALTAGVDTRVTGSLTLSVDLSNDDRPATDTTGDGLLNDVDGSGEFSIFDVQAFFNNFDTDVVQDNVELFDFQDDGKANIFDVQAIFNQLAAQG